MARRRPRLLSGMTAQTAPVQHPSPGPRQRFQQGENALQQNNLDLAERSFRGVLALIPQAVGAYANLGVTYMRRKQWPQALAMLHKAEHLAPRLSGIRLNLGLAYYRQNNFRAAIAPFEYVVHDAPHSYQARYLLGLPIRSSPRSRASLIFGKLGATRGLLHRVAGPLKHPRFVKEFLL